MTDAVKLPSVPQMLNRMNGGHLELLRAYRDGREVSGASTMSAGSIRGYRTCQDTLVYWGCVSKGTLTDRGVALLEAWEGKHSAG